VPPTIYPGRVFPMPAEVSLQAYDKDSLAKELKEFVSTNSTSPQAESVDRVYADLGKPKVRPEHTLIPMKKAICASTDFSSVFCVCCNRGRS